VVGEPGIGKTRLLDEFRRHAVDSAGARWIETQGVSHGRTLPFHLVAGLVRDLVGIREDDGAGVARQKLERLIPSPADAARTLDRGRAAPVDYLAHLLALPVSAEVVQGIEHRAPDAIRRKYVQAIEGVLTAAAVAAPLVVVVEDAHWADESSVATLVGLLPALGSARGLFVATSRSDPRSAAGQLFEAARATFAERVRELDLAPLTEQDSRELVAHLLEIESLPEAVRGAILSRSEGNPFFVEEIIRMLVDRGVVVHRGDRWVAQRGVEAVEIPPTIHGLLLARIDALPDGARRAIRAASVIGRTFARAVLDEVAGPLDGSLAALEATRLIAPETGGASGRFTFRHALVQETAYDSILRRDRAELHRAVAEAIQHAEPDRLEELAAELAMHFDAAGDPENAAEWAFRAGRYSERHSAMPEARELYDRAAEWLPDDPAHARRRIEIALGQGRSGLYFQAFSEEIERLTQAAAWAEALGDPRLLVEVDAALAFALQIRGDQYETSEALRRAVDRAVEVGATLGDDPIRGRPLLARGGARLMAGDYEEAVVDLAAAVPLLEESGDLLWAFEAQNNLAWGLSRLGRPAETDAAVARAVELAKRSGSPTANVDVKSTVAINYQEREDFDTALRIAQEAASEGEEKRVLTCAAFGHLTAGEILLRRGDTADAERALNRATRLARVMKAAFIENLGSAGLNAARWASGRRDEALAGWAQALERSRASGDPYAEAEVRWRRGAALAGETATRHDGIADLEAAAQGFAVLGARPARARALLDLATALAAAGRDADATRVAIEVRELRKELGLPVAPS
jgi:predicted ATPase